MAIRQDTILTASATKRDSWTSIVAKDWRKHWKIYMMIIPVLVYYFVWCYGPMYGILIAFKSFLPKGYIRQLFVGLRHFKDFLRVLCFQGYQKHHNDKFWNLVFVSIAYCICAVIKRG